MENEYLEGLDDALYNVTNKKSEADIYIDKMNNALNDVTHKRGALSGDTNYFGGQGFGESRYDDITLTESQFDLFGNDVNEMRAQRQPWLDKAGAGLVRIGTKVISEVAKMPGIIGGVLAAGASDNPWETAFNNSWIKSIEEFSQHVNNEYLPVYVKKAVSEGNLWDNISSIDFWAKEGADGIGFIASMFVPGLALSKIGAGTKIVRGLSKAGTKMLGSHENALQVMKQLGITGKNIDVFNATMANTLFEAGAEAGHAMQNLEEQLDAQLKSGEISQEEYSKLIQNKEKLGRNVFVSNVGILLGPNLISNKILLGKGASALKAKDFYKKGSKELIGEISKTPGKTRVLNYMKEYGKGFLREGFFEEGLQGTAENYFSEKAKEGKDVSVADFLGDIGQSYMDMINTTDGQKAIFLGGFLGGPMNVYQKYKTDKADTSKKRNLLNAMTNSINAFNVSLTDIYKKNEDGSFVLDKEGNRVKDINKVNKVGSALNQIEDFNNVLEIAEITGNKELADAVRSQIISSTVLPFITEGEVGIELLKDQLQGINDIKNNVEKYNNAYGTNLTKDSYINDIISQAKDMQEDYERYNTFSRDIISLENKDATPAEKNDFYNTLQNSYLLTKARRKYIQKYLNGLISEKSKLDSEYEDFWKGNKEALAEENKDNIKMSKPRYKNVIDKINETEKLLEELIKQEDSFWDNKEANSEFNKIVEQRKLHDKKIENKEEEIADKTIEDINNSKEESDVDEAIKNTKDLSKETADVIKKTAENKKDEIEDKLQNQSSEQVNKIKEEENDSNNVVFETGQNLNIDNNPFTISKENEDEYRIVGIPGQTWDHPLSGKIVSKKELASLTNTVLSENTTKSDLKEDSTEGGEINKSTNKVDIIESTNYFNNEGETYEKDLTPQSTEDLLNNEIKREHVKVIGVTPKGEKLKFINDSFKDYLQNGINKVGDKVTFDLGQAFDEKSKKAIEVFNSLENIKEANDLLNLENSAEAFEMLMYLPIKVITKEGHESFLTARPNEKSGELSKQIFNENELPLRSEIILKALSNNKNFNGITSTIEFQYPGLIQKAPKINNKIPENNILDLNHINDYTDVNLMFVKNNNGDLYGEEKEDIEDFLLGAPARKGYIYMPVPMANGRLFPMKLNVSKLKLEEADLVFRLYNEILNSSEKMSISMTLDNLSDSLQTIIKDNFQDELSLFNTPYKDIKAFEFIELFVYDNPQSNLYKFKIDNGSLVYGSKRANGKALPEFRENILSWLQNQKRRHISIKTLSGESNIDKNKYKKYLVEKGILNTDTVVNEPIFQGNTNIYISKKIENNSENILNSENKNVSLPQEIEIKDTNKENLNSSIESGFDFMDNAKKSQQDPEGFDFFETKC